jgi:predicted metal-binding protein
MLSRRVIGERGMDDSANNYLGKRLIFDELTGLGVEKIASIPVRLIRFDWGYRKYCVQNLCGNYDRSWTCPPNGGSPESIAEEIQNHENGIVFKVSGDLRCAVDWKSMMKVADSLNKVCFHIVDKIIPKIGSGAVFGYGPCKYCAKCAYLTKEPCRSPKKRVRSLECACVDVGKIAEICGMRVKDDEDRISFFGLFVYGAKEGDF